VADTINNMYVPVPVSIEFILVIKTYIPGLYQSHTPTFFVVLAICGDPRSRD